MPVLPTGCDYVKNGVISSRLIKIAGIFFKNVQN